jgi:transcriptional regulator with GAF, ATPase, and Fis domain
MHEIPTLVTGPSGTGKELVARAIGLSRYVPFNPNTRQFTQETGGAFFSLNVSALAPTVVESELFGHKRGAFTGAVQDRAGWFELTASSGTIFLDEIGELDPSIQVKLLRVLQTRQFQRVGDTHTQSFSGKLVTATSRDLAHEMRRNNFREDLYYRLCADVVVTPSLRQQLSENPDDLYQLVGHVLGRIVDEQEVPDASRDVVDWIRKNIGKDYAWPGNVRELEQCVRSVIVRKSYRPAVAVGQNIDSFKDLVRDIEDGSLSADQLLNTYCKMVYAKTKSYQETSRRLGLDRRTVKSRVMK